jgi:aminopeptidase N
MRDAKPAAIHLKDYRPPAYLVTHTDLHFQLWEDHALVTSRLQLRRNAGVDAATPLQLDGVGLELLGLRLDGQEVGAGHFTVTPVSSWSAEPGSIPGTTPRWRGCTSPMRCSAPSARPMAFARLPTTRTDPM